MVSGARLFIETKKEQYLAICSCFFCFLFAGSSRCPSLDLFPLLGNIWGWVLEKANLSFLQKKILIRADSFGNVFQNPKGDWIECQNTLTIVSLDVYVEVLRPIQANLFLRISEKEWWKVFSARTEVQAFHSTSLKNSFAQGEIFWILQMNISMHCTQRFPFFWQTHFQG